MRRLWERLKSWAASIKRDIVALYLAARDPRTPVLAKVVAGCVVAYALSPLDLIPDFIPVIGYLDDLLILPLGIMFAVRLIPPDLMAEFRRTATEGHPLPIHWAGVAIIISLWLIFAAAILLWLFG